MRDTTCGVAQFMVAFLWKAHICTSTKAWGGRLKGLGGRGVHESFNCPLRSLRGSYYLMAAEGGTGVNHSVVIAISILDLSSKDRILGGISNREVLAGQGLSHNLASFSMLKLLVLFVKNRRFEARKSLGHFTPMTGTPS